MAERLFSQYDEDLHEGGGDIPGAAAEPTDADGQVVGINAATITQLEQSAAA